MDEQTNSEQENIEQEKKDTKNLEVLIDGRVYTLVGSCPEEHLQRIGRYIDKKITEARHVKPITSYNFDINTLFIIINIVDDLLYKMDTADALQSENNKLTAEIKRIKIENESLKTENEGLKSKMAEAHKLLEAEKKEHLKAKRAAEAADLVKNSTGE